MQALEFTEALKEIVGLLKAQEIEGTMHNWFTIPIPPNQQPPFTEHAKDAFFELLQSSRSGFDRLTMRPVTNKIVTDLELKAFYDPTRMRQLVLSISNTNSITQLRGSAEVNTYLEKFRSLVRLAATCIDLLEKEKIGELKPAEGVVRLELINYADEDGISPKRLETFAKTVSDLHRDLAIALGIASDTARFTYFDSGSDVLFGIKCAKEIADALNTLLAQVWDKFRFWRYDSFEKRMASIEKGLDIVDRIHESVQRNSITGEEGNILKIKIFKEVDDLIGIGATIPLDDSASVDQKQLLTEMRNTKLLGSGEVTEPTARSAPPDSVTS